MSNFKKFIKEKFSGEVSPEYSDAAWDKFSAFAAGQQPKKKDRKGIILFFGLLLMLLVAYTFIPNSQQAADDLIVEKMINESSNNEDALSTNEITESKKDDSPSITTATENNITKENSQSQTTKPLTQNNNNSSTSISNSNPTTQNNNSTNPTNASIPSDNSNSSKQNKTSVNTNNSSHSDGDSDNKNNPINPTKNNTTDESKSNNAEIISSADIDEAIETISTDFIESTTADENLASVEILDTQNRKPINIAKLETPISWLYFYQEFEDPQYAIPEQRKSHLSPLAIGIFGGTGVLFHRSISNQKMSSITGEFYYSPIPHFRIKSSIGLQQTTYDSRVLNVSLGLRSINYPGRDARFDRVTSTAIYTEAGIGIDYVSNTFKNISINFGPRFLYIKEISRSLDYNFEESEEINKVNTTVTTLNVHPSNIQFDLGFTYHMSDGLGVSLQGAYLKEIGNSEVNLPKQLRFYLGLTKIF